MIFLKEFDGIRYGLLENGDLVEMAQTIGQVFSPALIHWASQ